MRESKSEELSPLGLGTWAIGGPYEFGWGPSDDSESLQAIRSAVDQGITWIDTAPAYGYGHSEEVVGAAIKGMTDPPLVFTKCGRVWDSSGKVTSDLRPHSIRAQWQDSVRRLNVECLDLYQIHRPDKVTGTPLEESWAELAQLKSEGKVRSIGLSNVTLDEYDRCNAVSPVDSVQPFVNLLRRGDPALRQKAAANGAYVLAYSPMESGLLTGQFDAARVSELTEDDWRKHSPRFNGEGLAKAEKVVQELRQLANLTGFSVPELAVAWVLKQDGVTGAIVGARRTSQIGRWINAASIELPDAEWGAVEAAAELQ